MPQNPVTTYWPGMGDFKNSLCDENIIISSILKDQCQFWLREPILDVGAGLGDIARMAFPDKTAFFLDRNPSVKTENPNHTIVQGDFFSCASDLGALGTLLFSHSLQYLDDDWDAFSAYIDKLNPSAIISVTNDNSQIFGDIMRWAADNIPKSNIEDSEIRLSQNYKSAGIIDAPVTRTEVGKLEQYLKIILEKPTLAINQTVSCYERNI